MKHLYMGVISPHSLFLWLGNEVVHGKWKRIWILKNKMRRMVLLCWKTIIHWFLMFYPVLQRHWLPLSGLSFQRSLYNKQHWRIKIVWLCCTRQTCLLSSIKYLGSLSTEFLSCNAVHWVWDIPWSSKSSYGNWAIGTKKTWDTCYLLPWVIKSIISNAYL